MSVKLVYVVVLWVGSVGHSQAQVVQKTLSERLDELSQRTASRAIVQAALPSVTVPATPPLSFYIDNKDVVLGELANHHVQYKVYSADDSGNLMLLASKVEASNKRLVIRSEHSSFKYVEIGNTKEKYGFSIAISADLVTTKADVNLSNLFAVGVAAKANRVAGTLTVQVTGLSGEPILNGLPTSTSSISEESIQKALETVATIKAKIYDPRVTVIPQVLGDPVL